MDGFAQKLQYFSDESIMLEVPFFQRPYVWEKKHWEPLLNSIKNEKSNSMPFIGSFIFQATDDEKKFLVIDGQQRITTISILIKAFLDVLKGKISNDVASKFKSIIYEMDTTENLEVVYFPRLVPSSADKQGFDLVMAEDINIQKVDESTDNIVMCYRYFKEEFEKIEEKELLSIGAKILTKPYLRMMYYLLN